MLGWAAIAGWALKKWWRAVAETGAKVAITASLWETLWAKVAYGTAKTVEWIGKWTVKIGEILQVPYKVTNKMAEAIIMPPINLVWKWLKIGVELSGKVPWVQQVATLVKWSVVRVLAGEGARIVGSRDAPSLPKYQIGATGDIGKVKPFEKWEWKPIVEESKVSEKPNSERRIIDVPKTLISFEEFEKLPWWWHSHTKADLLKMYENYKEFVSLTPKEQSARIYEFHSYLDEKIVWQLAYNDVLWAWNFWIVIKDWNNPQLAFKINKDLAKGTLEASIHNRVSALIEAANAPEGSILRKQYKADYGVDIIWKPPANVDVPRIRVWDKWQFTMKAIDGESVLTKMFSEKQWFNWYEWVLEAVKRSYPHGYKFTDYELYRAMADIYKFWEWHLKDRIRDPELQQLKKFTASYVGHNAPQIATLDDFLIRNGIHQWDLHWWNIVVPHSEPWKVYLIDFGEAVLSK